MEENAWKMPEKKRTLGFPDAAEGFQGFVRLKREFSISPFCAPTLCHPLKKWAFSTLELQPPWREPAEAPLETGGERNGGMRHLCKRFLGP